MKFRGNPKGRAELKKTGFVTTVRAKGKVYYYLRKSKRVNGTVKKENIYSFGTKEKALNNLSNWISNKENIPLELLNLGYDEKDLVLWYEEIKKK